MRKLIVGLTVALSVGVAVPAGARVDPVVAALNTVARPVQDVGRMVGDADVVGVGEATHGTREFFLLQRDVFTELVHTKGFGTFAREVSWSGGLRIDDYVTRGIGDPVTIMREEFQGNYQWNTAEYLGLIRWMRAYNLRHPGALRFMGDDIGYPGPHLFSRVLDWVREHRPEVADEIASLYSGLAPTVGPAEWMRTYPALPPATRVSYRDRADAARALLDGADPWIVQHATVIAKGFTMFAADFADPGQVTAAFNFREKAMADNLLWWREHTGDKIVMAGHDGHVSTVSYWENYPAVQGTFLRQRLGDSYVSVGTTFHHGSFVLFDNATGRHRVVDAGLPGNDTNESTLDQVRRTTFAVDMRTAPPVARQWLAQPRNTRQYAEKFPAEPKPVALAKSFDILVHVDRGTPARLLP
jgi:erythromycin esterase